MTTVQPILALVLACLCLLVCGLPPGTKRFTWPGVLAVGGYIAFLAASTYCAIKLGKLDDHRAVIASMIAGALVSIASTIISNSSAAVPLALASAGACVAHLVRADSFPEVSLVYAFAVASGALFFGAYKGAIAAGVIGALITMTDYLGKAGDEITNRAMMGVALGLALSVSAVVYLSIKRVLPKATDRMDPAIVALLAMAAGFAVSKWAIGGSLWIVVGTAAFTALVVHLLVPQDRDAAPLRVGLAAVTWIALTTIAFSILGGFGMAMALLEGAVILVLLQNGRALLTLGPAIGLVMYRVMRDASPDTSRALDLGQHYGVTGVVVGAVIPLLYADWFERKRENRRTPDSVASLLWGFILICVPVLSIVVLGSKGASGVIVGLGFSGFLLAYRKLTESPVVAIILAAGAANAVAVDWIGEALDYTRQEKLHAFGWWALAMALAAAGILAVSRSKVTEEAA